MSNPNFASQQHPEGEKQRYWRIIKILGHTCARILLSINRPVSDFVRVLNEGMIDLITKTNPRITIAELSLRTGIDRRQISAYLKKREVTAWKKTSTSSRILGEIRRVIHIHYPDGLLPINGDAPSFESICAQLVPGRYHSRAVLTELIRTGNLSEENGFVRLVNDQCTPDSDSLDFLNMTVWALEQLSRTIEYNRLAPTSQRNFQRSVYSTQIPPWQVEQLHPAMRELLQKQYQEVVELLQAKEDPTVPVGFYPPYGASFFELGRTENNPAGPEQLFRQMTFENKDNHT